MGTLDGHRAIVTGGGGGIGAAVCRHFAGEGAHVAVLDRRAEAADAIAHEVGGIGVACDVADPHEVARAVEAAADALGGITDLVNNAGMGRNQPLHEYSDDEWDLVVRVNLTGAFYCMRAVIPLLLDTGGGSIVNNASLNALRPLPGEAPYSAAKAGLVNLTMTTALEYAPLIRVNCVSPGLIDTPLTEMVTANPAWVDAGAARHAAGASRIGRRGRRGGRLLVLGRCELHHGTEHRHRRRLGTSEPAGRFVAAHDHGELLERVDDRALSTLRPGR